MRNILNKKLNNKKGFTLAELLIVVAIIAILVAIMIPVFASSKANAILSKNAANVRAIYSEKVIKAMEDNNYTGSKLQVALGITAAEIDKNTVVKYEGVETSGVTSGGKITITTPGATVNGGSEEIKVDADVTITDLDATGITGTKA